MSFQSLKSLYKNIPSKYILLFIVLIGFLLRANNLTIGFPILYVSNDEAIYHLSALNMIASKTPFTLGNYGPLGAYMQLPFLVLTSAILFLTGKVQSIRGIEFILATQEGYMLFIPRVISAMFGTLSILVIYVISCDLFKSKKTALWSAFLAAVCFNLVHISHLGRGWSPALFFSLLSVKYALDSVLKKGHAQKNTVLSFSFAAIAFGFHQMSAMVLLLVFLIKLYGSKYYNRPLKTRANFVGLFLLASFLFIFNWLSLGKNFFTVLAPENPTVGLVKLPPFNEGIYTFLKYFWDRGTFTDLPRDLLLSDGLIIFLAAIFFLRAKVQKIYIPFVIFFLVNLISIALVLPIFTRYLLISMIFLSVFAGKVISELSIRTSRIFFIVLIGMIAFNAIYWNILLLRKTTFNELRNWLDLNVPVDTPIAATNLRNIGYVPSEPARNVISEFIPNYYGRASSIVGDSYPYNVRNIIYVDSFDTGSKQKNFEEALRHYPVKYIIDSYMLSGERLINKNSSINLELVAHFSPTGDTILEKRFPQILVDAGFAVPLVTIERPGIYFDVLKVN